MADRRERRAEKAAQQAKGPYYVKIGHDLLESEAWLHLSPRAFKLLVAMWHRHRGPKNNGHIPYSRDEACRVLHCGEHQAGKAFRELEHKGFIRLTRDSHFSMKTKTSREWEITAEPTATHGPAEDFKAWRPE